MIKIIKYSIVIIVYLTFFCGLSQDCTLDIGGGNTEVLTSVFQLNANQVTKLEALQGEFIIKAKASQDEMEKLLTKHPQSTPEELTKLGEKYSVLEQNLINLSRATDKEFLEIFNEKQYNRYLDLCREAIRKPIVIQPIIYIDSISPR